MYYIKKPLLQLKQTHFTKMKQIILYTTICFAATMLATSCDGPIREPNTAYMPDMYTSRAVESYPNLDPKLFTENDTFAGNKIYYDRKPVLGTVKRGQMGAYRGTNDSMGIAEATAYLNPLPDSMETKFEKTEGERIYKIYCGICHGEKLDGMGPLIASGKWAGAAANLMDLTKFGRTVYADGRVFHSITYGKNSMGGYASQLNNKQRWMIVNYIRTKQAVKEKEELAAKQPANADTTSKSATKAAVTPKVITP